MSIIFVGLAMLAAGVLIPFGIVLGLFLGTKLLLWWLDRALQSDDTKQP